MDCPYTSCEVRYTNLFWWNRVPGLVAVQIVEVDSDTVLDLDFPEEPPLAPARPVVVAP